MKKYLSLLLLLLLSVCVFADDFELKQLNLGNYTANDMKIKSYNDCSLRIIDYYSNTQVIFNTKDTDTLLKVSKFLKDFFIEKRIPNIDTLIDFFDYQNIKYNYEKFSDSEDFYISSQSFLEDFLVQNYGFPSGCNRKDNFFQFDWDSEKGYYKNGKEIYDSHTVEYFDYNGKYYNSRKDTYNTYVDEYSDYDGKYYQTQKRILNDGEISLYTEYDDEKSSYQKCETSYNDGSKGIYIGGNSDYWEKQVITAKDGTITEYTNYNEELEGYKDKKITDPSGTITYLSDLQKVTMHDGSTKTYYFYKKTVYEDYYTEKFYSGWNSEDEVYDDIELKSSDLTKQYYYHLSNYDSILNDYTNKVYMYPNGIISYSNPDITGFYEINVYNNDNIIISYKHVTKPWDAKKKTRDIEVFTDGIVYKYKGVTAIDENNMVKFKSCEYVDKDGKKHREKNKEITYDEFVIHNIDIK